MSSLMRWSPFFPSDAFEDFDELFSHGSHFLPAVDMYQTQDAITVEIPLAGIDPEKVEIFIEDGMLRIQGTSSQKTEVEDQEYLRREIRHGSFSRSIPLPTSVREDEIRAVSENGMLKINLPKQGKETKKPVKITVKPN